MLLYTSELEIDAAHIPAFLEWYAYRHAPDIYQIGFRACTCYRSVAGEMTLLDLYEIDSTDIFDTPQYRSIAPSDPYSSEVLVHRRAKAHTVYAPAFVAPDPVDARALLNADWIGVERFDCADETGLLGYLRSGEAERILLAGAKRVRLARRTQGGPKHVSHRPAWFLLVEWPQQPSIADIGNRLRERLGVSGHSFFVGQRLYPWKDKP